MSLCLSSVLLILKSIWRDENRGEKCIGSLEELYAEIEKSVAAGIMQSNPLKENGFVPGDYSQCRMVKDKGTAAQQSE